MEGAPLTPGRDAMSDPSALSADPRAADGAGTPAQITAADRVQTRDTSPAPRRGFSLRRLGVMSLVGAGLAVAALVWSGDDEASTDLLRRFGRSVDVFRPELVTVDARAAERYILDAFGWPISAPSLPDLQLIGVGEATVAQTNELAVDVPAFRYDDRDGDPVVVFVYDYVLLDQTGGLADLPEPVYARLAEDPPVDVRRQGGHSFVTWRRRSVVYTAVTGDEDQAEAIALSVRE